MSYPPKQWPKRRSSLDRAAKATLAFTLFSFLVGLAVVVGVIYVAVHFITKLW